MHKSHEFKNYVRDINDAYKCLGSSKKVMLEEEKESAEEDYMQQKFNKRITFERKRPYNQKTCIRNAQIL